MLKISKAAIFAAVLSLSAVPSIGLVNAVAQDAPAATTTATTGVTTQLTIPTITAVDSTMDEAALRDALTGGFMKHVDELAKLSATSITIPEISLTMTVTGGDTPVTSTMSYKNIVLSNVKDGVAATVSMDSAETTTAEGGFKFGKMSTGAFDIGGILGLYSLVPAGSADQPMKPLYKDFSFDGGSFTSPKASCDFGKISVGEFDARPLKVSFAQLMEAAQKMQADAQNPPPEAVSTYVNFMADMFTAFKSEPVDMNGVSCKGTGDDGKPFVFSIGGVKMDGFQPGIYPAITVNDIKIGDGAADSVSLGSATLKAIDLSGPIAVVKANSDKLTSEWFEANYRKLIPSFAGFSLSNLAVDVPDPDHEGQRINATVGDFDVTLSDYLNGIPTKISSSAHGVAVPIPADSTDDNMKMLLAVGITKLNLAYELSAAWDKATHTINVYKVSVSGEDLGSAAFAFLIGNAADTLFADDANVMMTTAMGLTVKNAKLDLVDNGLGNDIVPLIASQSGEDPATFREKMSGTLEGATLQLLGGTDAAHALGTAIGNFVAGKAKSLSVNIASKDPAGIPVPLFMQASNDPSVLTGAVDITGSAQ